MGKKKIIINIISSFAMQGVAIIYGLIIPRLIIETYGSEVNGLIVSITQFLGYIVLLEAGIGPVVKSALYKPISEKNKEKIKSILKSAQSFFRKIAIAFILYILILMFIIPNIVSDSFDNIFIISLIAIMAIGKSSEYFFGILNTLYLQAEQKNFIDSIIRIAIYIINIIIIYIVVKFKLSILIVQSVIDITFLLKPLIQYVYIKKKYNLNLRSKNIKKEELNQKMDALIHHIAFIINWNTDVVVLTILTNLKEVSVYSVYTLVLIGIRTILISVASVFEAPFGQLWAKENINELKRKFENFEKIYISILAIIYSIVFVTIIPFIQVYTVGIKDVNYIQPLFANLIVLAYLTHAIRVCYTTLIFPIGHFKQTSKGAWVEAIINILLSIILVAKFGIIGVAIGTCVALGIRAIEFMIYVSKKILNKKVWGSVKVILVAGSQIVIVIILSNILPEFDNISYIGWIIYAVQVGIIACLVIGTSSSIIYRSDIKEVINILKNLLKRKNSKIENNKIEK